MRSLLFVLTGALLVAGSIAATCTVNHYSMKTNQPLLLKPNGTLDARGFINADSSRNINLQTGETVLLVCPGDNNYMIGGNALPWQEIIAECNHTTSFLVNDRVIDLLLLECYSAPVITALDTWVSCSNDPLATVIDVGFRLPRGFLAVYKVCFDKTTLSAQYTTHYVVAGGRSPNTLATNSSFFFIDVNPAVQYQQTKELSTFTYLIGLENANRYVTTTNYIVSHQMVPRGDLVYWPMQRCAYYYINSYPMWRKTSIGIWAKIEDSIVDLTSSQGDLYVYSAMYGVATLNNTLNVPTELYLYAEGEDRRMTVPAYLAKEVTNSKDQRVLFVEHVNVGAVVRQEGEEPRPICADVCAELGWLRWDDRPFESRSVFCCRADDPQLLETIPELKQRLLAPVALLK